VISHGTVFVKHEITRETSPRRLSIYPYRHLSHIDSEILSLTSGSGLQAHGVSLCDNGSRHDIPCVSFTSAKYTHKRAYDE